MNRRIEHALKSRSQQRVRKGGRSVCELDEGCRQHLDVGKAQGSHEMIFEMEEGCKVDRALGSDGLESE
jgi:hypothetical protein